MTNKKEQKGFSLVEIMVVVFISVIVIYIFSEYVSKSFRSIRFVEEFNNAVENAAKGVKSMNAEVREAINPDTGVFPIVSAGENELIFYVDSDNDGDKERVRFYLDGTELKRGEIQPTGNPPVYTAVETITIISQYVQNTVTEPIAPPVFTYFDTNNIEISQPVPVNDIKLVHAHLEINETPEKAPVNFQIDTSTQLRNLK